MYIPQYVSYITKKKESNITILKRGKNTMKCELQISHTNTCVLYQIPLIKTNAVHYAVNSTSIKCPISCHKTPVQNDVW
jgi:hypothetical protein